MGRRLDQSYIWRGEVYCPTPDGRITNPAGQDVELPADFPSDAELQDLKRRAGGLTSDKASPMEKTIASTKDEDEKKSPKKGAK